MRVINKNLDNIFYSSFLLALIIYFLPPEYTFGVYTPNVFGWFWILGLIPISIITFVLLLIVDLKKRNSKRLIIRSFIFLSIIGLCIVYWFYQAKMLGNI